MPKLDPLKYIRSGISEGLSANAAYRRLYEDVQTASRETGDKWTGLNRSTFLQMYSELRSIRGSVPDAMNAPRDQPAGGLSPGRRQTTRPGGYGNWAKLFFREVGQGDLQTGYYFARSSEPLTPQEIEDRVRADFEASAADEHGSVYRHVIEGVSYTGTETLVPREDMPF